MTTIEELVKAERERGDAHGIMVRCPIYNAGVGKWCRDEAGKVIKHEPRVRVHAEMRRLGRV